jgi:hypothetical protein
METNSKAAALANEPLLIILSTFKSSEFLTAFDSATAALMPSAREAKSHIISTIKIFENIYLVN